jgi:hypothetical protein
MKEKHKTSLRESKQQQSSYLVINSKVKGKTIREDIRGKIPFERNGILLFFSMKCSLLFFVRNSKNGGDFSKILIKFTSCNVVPKKYLIVLQVRRIGRIQQERGLPAESAIFFEIINTVI